MDEGAVNEGVGDEKDAMNEKVSDDEPEDMDKDGEVRNEKVTDEEIGDEDRVVNEDEEDRVEIWYKEDRDEEFMDEVVGVKVKVPTN